MTEIRFEARGAPVAQGSVSEGRPVSHRTDTGFVAGAAEVICVASFDGYQVLWIQTATTRVEVVVTPKGRKITVKEGLTPVERQSHRTGVKA